jgi:hypothetical protein
MFDPAQPRSILNLTSADLSRLPSEEDDRHEYKSGRVKDKELAEKIRKAASGFWNSGGGLFVAGVGGDGIPDGGIPVAIDRQSRRDWIDQAIGQVAPTGPYIVHNVDAGTTGLNILPGNQVYLIGFGRSDAGPHQAPDSRYYLRAGAHTVPAQHFIVEAMFARRSLRFPLLSYVVRYKPDSRRPIAQLGIVCLNSSPALDVRITIDPLPPMLDQLQPHRFPLRVPVISDQHPFLFDCTVLAVSKQPRPKFTCTISYSDLTNQEHQSVFPIDLDQHLGPNFGSMKGIEDVAKSLDKIANNLLNPRPR